MISGNGGRRSPDLTYIGDTLSESDIIIRIVNGNDEYIVAASRCQKAESFFGILFLD